MTLRYPHYTSVHASWFDRLAVVGWLTDMINANEKNSQKWNLIKTAQRHCCQTNYHVHKAWESN